MCGRRITLKYTAMLNFSCNICKITVLLNWLIYFCTSSARSVETTIDCLRIVAILISINLPHRVATSSVGFNIPRALATADARWGCGVTMKRSNSRLRGNTVRIVNAGTTPQPHTYTENALRTLCTLAARSTESLFPSLSRSRSRDPRSIPHSIPQARCRLFNESGAVKWTFALNVMLPILGSGLGFA